MSTIERCPRCGSTNISGKKSDMPPRADGGRSTYYEFRCGDCGLWEDHNNIEADFDDWIKSWSTPASDEPARAPALEPSALRALLGRSGARMVKSAVADGQFEIDTCGGSQRVFELILALPNDAVSIAIGPEPSQLLFDWSELRELVRWARILEVENVLAHPDDNDRFVKVVRAFDDYCAFAHSGTLLGGPVRHGPALGQEGHFLTVCTAPDAVEAYLATGDPIEVARTNVLHMRGELLFEQLRERAAELGIDGMLFNPCGPPASAVFLIGVLQLL